MTSTSSRGGGRLKGWKLTPEQMDAVADALTALCAPYTYIY